MKFNPLSQPNLRFRNLIFYAATLAGILVVYFKFSEIKTGKDLFLRSNYYWLSAALLFQVMAAYFLALNYRTILLMKGLVIPVKELLPMTFVVQFLNQALPSATISGQVFFVHYLRRFQLSIAEAISRAVLEFASLYTAFGILFIISIVLSFNNGIYDSHWEARFLIYLFSTFALLFMMIFWGIQRQKRSHIAHWIVAKIHFYFESHEVGQHINKAISRLHLDHIKTLFEQMKQSLAISELQKSGWQFSIAILWYLLVLLANVATLYVIPLALGYHIPLTIIFIVYTLTKFLSMISFVPGGLGIFEGGMTLMFISFGFEAQVAFAITILFRAITFWLPMPIGWLLYRRYTRRSHHLDEARY